METTVETAKNKLEELRNLRKEISQEIRAAKKIVNESINKDSILIFSPRITNRLLDLGHTIIHVKKDRSDRSGRKSVFVFKLDDTIIEDLEKVKEVKADENTND